MGELIGLVVVLGIFGTPFVAVIANHRQKIAEIKERGGGGGGQNSAVVAELQDLKRQVAELRDTSTRFDMSFDTALQRLESRMGRVEERISGVEGRSNAVVAGRD